MWPVYLVSSSGSSSRPPLASGQLVSGVDPALLSGGAIERPAAEDVDVVLREGQLGILRAVQAPEPPDPALQAPLVLIDRNRDYVEISELRPNSVICHVYDLKENFSRANEVLAFAFEGAAIGGLFHASVEVFGTEWTYGTCGVCKEMPRTTTEHVYNCSVVLGNTTMSELEVAELLYDLCEDWRGADYDILSRNCCSFAAEFLELLEVGALPPWINRFARLLHGGRATTRYLARQARRTTKLLGRQATAFAESVGIQSASGRPGGLRLSRGSQLSVATDHSPAHSSQSTPTGSATRIASLSSSPNSPQGRYLQQVQSPLMPLRSGYVPAQGLQQAPPAGYAAPLAAAAGGYVQPGPLSSRVLVPSGLALGRQRQFVFRPGAAAESSP